MLRQILNGGYSNVMLHLIYVISCSQSSFVPIHMMDLLYLYYTFQKIVFEQYNTHGYIFFASPKEWTL